jgi:hypothetical protein
MFVALGRARYHHPPQRQQGAVQASSPIIGPGNAQPDSVVFGSLDLGSLEETMTTRLAVITLTLLFAAVCLTGRAEAGASASAPSKNTRVSAQQTNHKTAKNDIGITEYSSSSARGHSR